MHVEFGGARERRGNEPDKFKRRIIVFGVHFVEDGFSGCLSGAGALMEAHEIIDFSVRKMKYFFFPDNIFKTLLLKKASL